MKYIVFDTEFTSWEGSHERNWSGHKEFKEMVQIGAIKVENKKIIDTLDIYIKPVINPILSDYFINLTGITNDKIEKEGVLFEEAFDKFYQFSEGCKLYSYGNDYFEIEENIKLYNIKRDFIDSFKKNFYDFKDKIKNIDVNKYTSGTIYKAYNIKFDKKLKLHNGFDDAYSLYLVSKIIF
jgi:inhibitor of KinA sporulation pathway (predicted exonuclease)